MTRRLLRSRCPTDQNPKQPLSSLDRVRHRLNLTWVIEAANAVPRSSAGVTMRVNIAGVAVGQFDMVRPFQRPGKGWVFQFNLTPGF